MRFTQRRMMSQQHNNWPFIFNVGNSIIGVTLLAMPFCFQQCGMILGALMLFFSTWLTIKSCQLLVKAGIASRRRSFSLLAYFTHGAIGKLMVEVCMIGLQLGTLVAQVVVIGDLGPAILSKATGFENTSNLRTTLIVGLCLFVALPLGLLKDLRTLNKCSTVCILFYTFVVGVVFLKSLPNLYTGIWYSKIRLWRVEGFFKCLPIFSFAFGCQTQIFIVYNTLAEPSLKRINSIISSAVLLCTAAYLLVAFFGYIAFCDETRLSGDIFNHFKEDPLSDTLKLCFVIAIAVSIPLIVFPCRASLYTLLFPQHHERETDGAHLTKPKDDEPGIAKIPEQHFQIITMVIIVGAMVTAILVPNVELVLGLTGATMGTLICYIFPALFFMNIMSDASEGRFISKIVLVSGLTVLIASTYTTLLPTETIPAVSLDKDLVDTGIDMAKLVGKSDIVADVKNDVGLVDLDAKSKPPDSGVETKRQEPPVPEAPDELEDQKLKKEIEDAKLKEQENVKEPNIDNTNKAKVEKDKEMKVDAVDGAKKDDPEEKGDEKKLEEKKEEEAKKEEEKKKEEAKKEEERKKEEEEKKKEEEKKIEEEKKQEDEKKRIEAEQKQQEILNKLEQQQEEQEKLINEQKKILEYLKEHKDDHKDAPVDPNAVLQQGQNVMQQQQQPVGGLVQNQGLIQNVPQQQGLAQQQGLVQANVANQLLQGQPNQVNQQVNQQPQQQALNQNLVNQPVNLQPQQQNVPLMENIQGNVQQPIGNQLNVVPNVGQNVVQNAGIVPNQGQNLVQNQVQNVDPNLALNVVQNPGQNLVVGQQVGNQVPNQLQQVDQQQVINQQNLAGQQQQQQLNVVNQQQGNLQAGLGQQQLPNQVIGDPQKAQQALLNDKLKDQGQLNLKVQDEGNSQNEGQEPVNLNPDLDIMKHRGKRDVDEVEATDIEQQNTIERNKDITEMKVEDTNEIKVNEEKSIENAQEVIKGEIEAGKINTHNADTVIDAYEEVKDNTGEKVKGVEIELDKVTNNEGQRDLKMVVDGDTNLVRNLNADDDYVNEALKTMNGKLKFEHSQRIPGLDIQDAGKMRRR